MSEKFDCKYDGFEKRSWWSRTFGRSILSLIGGSFFEKKTNTMSLIAILLIGTLCYVIFQDKRFEYIDKLMYLIFTVVGYYFGARQPLVENDNDDQNQLKKNKKNRQNPP